MAKIVLMEDDAATRALIASVLKKDGHEVLESPDGASGLMLVEGHHPDLVISDIQMPALDGFQMLASLRRNPDIAGTPVILLTSLQERAHMRIGMTHGRGRLHHQAVPPRRVARGGDGAAEQARDPGQPAGDGGRQGGAARTLGAAPPVGQALRAAARGRTERALACTGTG